MKRRESFLPTFLVVVFLCVIILALSFSGNLQFLSSFLEKGTSAIQVASFGVLQRLPFISQDLNVKKLQDENLDLLNKIADLDKLRKENAALSDQFQTSYPASNSLLEAKVIGAPSFIPGVSVPNVFILNKGTKDNLKIGQAVVVKNNLVGVISQISANISKVSAINNVSLSFTAKTQNGAMGVVRGGGNITLDNVLLSENIKENELVMTYGDVDFEGVYVPPDLIVGKIISVDKNASDLFQKAKIESFIDFSKLSTVFIYMGAK